MEQTAVSWYAQQEIELTLEFLAKKISELDYGLRRLNLLNQAKEMEKAQMGYTNEDVLRAGEMGEINHHDTKHIVSYLDEAKHYNETFKKK